MGKKVAKPEKEAQKLRKLVDENSSKIKEKLKVLVDRSRLNTKG